jgi:hypothetical protein
MGIRAPVPPENEPAQTIAACRAAIGHPPRKLGDSPHLKFAPPGWMSQFPRDPLWEIYRHQAKLYQRGVVVWGHIVQANNRLFTPGPDDCPASVIYSPDPALDNKPASLERIAQSLFAVKGTGQSDAELAEFSRLLANERDRAMRLAVPKSLCEGVQVYHTGVMVVRKHLPRGYLTGSLFPLLIQPSITPAAIILPSQYWPPELTERWRG